MLRLLTPDVDGAEAFPVRNCDSDAVRSAGAFNAEITGHLRGKLGHPLRCDAVAGIVLRGADRGKDDGEIRTSVIHDASTPSITCPCTSVSRRSMPLW